MNQWAIIRKTIRDIEMRCKLRFGNGSWKSIKQMDNDISALHWQREKELIDIQLRQADEIKALKRELVEQDSTFAIKLEFMTGNISELVEFGYITINDGVRERTALGNEKLASLKK